MLETNVKVKFKDLVDAINKFDFDGDLDFTIPSSNVLDDVRIYIEDDGCICIELRKAKSNVVEDCVIESKAELFGVIAGHLVVED